MSDCEISSQYCMSAGGWVGVMFSDYKSVVMKFVCGHQPYR